MPPPNKWIVRKRQTDGTIKHVATLEFKPTAQTLKKYGCGSYLVQRAGGRFSRAEKFKISNPQKEKEGAKVESLAQMPQTMPKQITREQKPASKFESKKLTVTTEELPLPLVRKRKVRKRIRYNRDMIKSYESQIAPEKPSPIHSDTPTKINNTSKLGKITKMEQKGFQISSMTSIVPKKTDMITAGSERNTKGAYNIDSTSRLEPLKLQSSNGIKVPPTQTVSESKEIARLAAEPSERREAPQKKYIRCTRCMEKLCEEDDLSLWRDEIIRCEFCNSFFCRECFTHHICHVSEICYSCKTRFPKEQVHRAEYCMKAFCSQRCKDSCYAKNRDKHECRGCGAKNSKGKEPKGNEQDENSEEDIYCTNCSNLIDEDDYPTYFCKNCEELFCSKRCFNRYHRRRSLGQHDYSKGFD